MLLTANGTYPITCSIGATLTIALSGVFGGATVAVSYATAPPVAASLTIADGASADAIVLTAIDPGTHGNAITFAVVLSEDQDQPLTLTRTGRAIVVSPATSAGDAAAVTTAMTGTNNDLTLAAKVAGIGGNAYSIELLAGSGTTQALSVATTDYQKFSVTLARTAGAISTTATQLAAALTAYAPFAALMTAVVKSGDTGAGIVTALEETSLAGGGDNFAATTTYAQLLTLLNTDPLCGPHFTAAAVAEYDLDTVVAALAATPLAGGTAGTFVTLQATFPSTGAVSFTAAGAATVRNPGVTNALALVVTNASGPTSITALPTKP